MKNLSFIVLASFGYGVGTDKTMTNKCLSELKKNKRFIGKPHKTVESLFDGESGTTRHVVEMRLTPMGLKELLFDYVYPEEVCHTGGSITLGYGWCDAISFNAVTHENYSQKCIDSAELQASKLCKKLTGEVYYLCSKEQPYVCQCIEAMAGYTSHSIYVTPIVEREGGCELCENTWKFLESLIKIHYSDFEEMFVNFFDL